MELKKKKVQNVDASVLLRRQNKTLTGGNTGTNRGARIEEKIIQRLSHLGIHPLCSHQTHAPFLMVRSAYWQEPDIDASSEALPESYRYRLRMLAANHQTEHRDPSEGARERTESAERFATSWEEQHRQPAKALRWRE